MAENPQQEQTDIITGQFDTYQKFKSENYYLFSGINCKASPYTNTQFEFRDLSNLNFFYPGSLTKRPGTTMYAGSTVTGNLLGGYEYAKSNGNSLIVFAANTNLYTATPPSSINTVVTGLLNGAIFDFVTYVDRLFCANGNNFFKFDGVNNYNYSLPPGATAAWGVTVASGGSLVGDGTTHIFLCAYGYVNERGYAGPTSNAQTITIVGSSTWNSIVYYGLTQAFSGYGITAIQLWRSVQDGANLFGTTLLALGGTQVTDTGFPLGSSLALPHLWFTMIPRFQSVYNNQFVMSGFSQMPSRIYWSEIGEPEGVQPTYYADIITNDGDRLTGHKFYNNSLVIGKLKSLFRLSGTDPSNFSLAQLTSDYGSLSHKAMVTFQNFIWMLDQKGIVQFDGAICSIVSNAKMDTFFANMNVPYAIDTACAVHFKQYNEVWFTFPYNGATLNNLIIVYDYLSNAWTHYDGINAACLFVAQGTQNVKTVFYGGYTGALFYFGASFMGDNGNAITCMAFTRWLAPSGQTIENMYRRFWGDIDPVLGITQAINLNFLKNYATNTFAATGTIYQNVYQSRLDFGISARSIAAQIYHASSTLPFKMNAFTFESRFQRSV